MGPKRVFTWTNWVMVLLVLVGWAGYRLYDDYQAAGGFKVAKVFATAATFCIFLCIMIVVFRYANRPETKDKP